MHLIQSYRSLQNKNYTTFFSFKDDFFFIQSQPITAKSVHIHLLIYNTHTDINRTILLSVSRPHHPPSQSDQLHVNDRYKYARTLAVPGNPRDNSSLSRPISSLFKIL